MWFIKLAGNGDFMKKVRQLISLMIAATVALACLPLFDIVYLYPSASRLVTEEVDRQLESLGRYVVSELDFRNDDANLQPMLARTSHSFGLDRLSVYTADGLLLSSSSAGAAEQVNLKALALLRKGKPFSQTLLEAVDGEAFNLIEVQLPVVRNGELTQVVILRQSVERFRSSLDQVVANATLFLLIVALLVLAIVVLTALIAHRAINRRLEADRSLEESREQLENKHRELEYVFDQVERAKYEWQLALDCIDDMILLIDSESRIRRCNEALIHFLDHSYLEILGKDWRTLLTNGQSQGVASEQRGSRLFHEQTKTWLQLDFYPYRDDGPEQLTVLRVQKLDAERELCAS